MAAWLLRGALAADWDARSGRCLRIRRRGAPRADDGVGLPKEAKGWKGQFLRAGLE